MSNCNGIALVSWMWMWRSGLLTLFFIRMIYEMKCFKPMPCLLTLPNWLCFTPFLFLEVKSLYWNIILQIFILGQGCVWRNHCWEGTIHLWVLADSLEEFKNFIGRLGYSTITCATKKMRPSAWFDCVCLVLNLQCL